MKRIAFYLIAVLTLVGISHAANRLVPGTYATVQAAVDAATTNTDTIVITTAGTYPGAVNITDKNLTIVAGVPGVVISGTITAYGQSTVNLKHLKISGTTFDGVVQAGFGDLTMTSCTITGNPGRGVLQSSPGNVIITSSTLSNNSFDGFNRSTGTASGGSLTVNGPSVIANNGRAGVLIETGPDGVATINGTLIRNNTVGVYVHTDLASVSLNNSTLLNNPQDQVLCDVKTTFAASNTTFTHTTAPTFMAGIRFDGAAGATGITSAQISGCHFKAAYPNNCLWLGHKTNLTINDTVIDGYSCSLNVADNSAAISNVVLTDSVFKGTTSVVIAFQGIDGNPAHTLAMTRCKLIGPTGTPSNLLNAVATQANVSNCIFEGGDVQLWSQGDQSWLKAINCTLVGDNLTTAGMNFLGVSAQHLVANCIIEHTQLGMSAATGVTVANHHNLMNAITKNFQNVTSGTATLVNLDPKFVNAATADYHLQSDSPAVNAGDSTLGIAVDYDKKLRVAPYDLGAFEYITAPVNAVRHWEWF